MRAKYIKLSESDRQSFAVKNEVVPYFYNPYHYHPELELTLIQRGQGTRFIGDSIEPFYVDDLVLVGANLSHLWRSGNEYYQLGGPLSQAIVVHFSPDVWGEAFLALPEMKPIRALLTDAARGIRFVGDYRELVADRMNELLTRHGAERLAYLIYLLQFMADCPADDRRLLASQSFVNRSSHQDTERIGRVYHYTMEHFREPISLDLIADVANLSRTSFCRYFRSHTRKSYWDILIDIRIGHACKLLINTDLAVGQIALECGYNSISVFNEHFRRITGVTPLHYQKKHWQPVR